MYVAGKTSYLSGRTSSSTISLVKTASLCIPAGLTQINLFGKVLLYLGSPKKQSESFSNT